MSFKSIIYILSVATSWYLIYRITHHFIKPIIIEKMVENEKIKNDSTRHYIDENGRLHGEKKALQGTIQEMKAVYPELIDSLKLALEIKEGQLKSVIALGVNNSNTVKLIVDTVWVDSSKYFTYKDPWIDLKGRFGKVNELTYTTFDSLHITAYTRKSGFLGLGKKQTFIDAYSLNPHSSIGQLNGVLITEERPKRIGIGAYVGYGWNGIKLSPQIGIGFNYTLIRF